MEYLSSIFLGFIQGVAEFLPISSSGHLVIFQELFGMKLEGAESTFFDVLLHLGTLAAVFVAYWKDIKALVLEFFTMVHIRKLPAGQKPDRLSRRMIVFIIIGTLPLVAVLPVKDYLDTLYESTLFVGFALLVTGGLLFLSDHMNRRNKDVRNATIFDALIVGIGQAIAVVPGLSRSGTSISAGLVRGFNREFAVKFSFLLSIPAVLGANLLSLLDALQENIDWSLLPVYLVGVVSAAVFGYLSIILLKFITRKGNFGAFSFYCWGAGLVTIILSLIK